MLENNPKGISATEHDALLELIPWYLNGTLSEQEHKLISRHLETCLTCRAELNFHSEVARSVNGADENIETISHNFSKLRQKIAHHERDRNYEQRHSHRNPAQPANPLPGVRYFLSSTAIAAVIAMAAIGVYQYFITVNPDELSIDADFRTLSVSESEPSTFRNELFIAFQNDVSEAMVSEFFAANNLEPVSSSEDRRLWRVRIKGSISGDIEIDDEIYRLRDHEFVLLAERALFKD